MPRFAPRPPLFSAPGGAFRVPALLALLALLLASVPAFPQASLAAPSGNAAQNASQPAPAPDSLAQVWSARTEDLAILAKEAASLRASAEIMAAPLTAAMQDARTQIVRLSGLFQASRGHPAEQVALVQQMRQLSGRLARGIRPLEEMAGAINLRLEEVAGLQRDLDSLVRESAADGALPRAPLEGAAEQRVYARTLLDAKAKLTAASDRLDKILAPAKSTAQRVDQTLKNTEGSLPAAWKSYYLTPSGNDLDALTATPALLGEWASSLRSRLRFAWPQSADERLEALKGFAATAAIMGLISFLFLRGARVLAKRWHQACAEVLKGSWVWAAAGVSVLAAASSPYGNVYSAFLFAGSLMVIAGIAALSWRLRMAARPALKNKPSPLIRLFPAAACGVAMLFSDLPTRVLGFGWGLTIALFLAWAFHLGRKSTLDPALPFLERFSYRCALWFGLASLLVTLAGYARLAILLFMLLFALVNILTLGAALTALLESLSASLWNKEKFPVRHAVAAAASIPVAWVVSLLCAPPWVWAVPGADYFLRLAATTHYTVGDASLDLSRAFVIILLFFLFRSFVSLSHTSLDHLPEHLPHVEPGVIPPLRAMAGYALWALFGLVVLGLLGVNFTSLAVVAGGLSVGIGIGMQNVFNNLTSGLMLIFGRTILVGDVVDVAGVSGTVKAINIRSTTIETPERALVYVPNSAIMAGQFSNWTRNSRMVRRGIMVGVAYGSDTEQVKALLLEAAQKQEHVRKTPAPAVLFTNFGASSLDFTLNVFIDNIDNALGTLSAIRFEIEKSFREAGIEIPFPQMQLHMPGKGGSVEAN